MKIKDIIAQLDCLAPAMYQESYDNVGLLSGNADWDCTGVLISLDVTEAVIGEAIAKQCNLIVSHHPLIFSGIKRVNGNNPVERCLLAAVQHNIALFAIHTNLDNMIDGVNGRIADRLGLTHRRILLPKPSILRKLVSFVPVAQAEAVRDALFAAGAGRIGDYTGVSFNAHGHGTYTAGPNAHPFAGKPGMPHSEEEIRIETIFPAHLQGAILAALIAAHPYEEVAYDIIQLENVHPGIGSGLVGELPNPVPEQQFLAFLKEAFAVPVVRHSPLIGKAVKRVAVCGGSGSFLIHNALDAEADFFITADIRYHSFFEADGRMVLADIGHFESEQYTIDLLHDALQEKLHNFAILKTGVSTNPVNYYF